MKKNNKYTVIVGNVGTMEYTNKKLAMDAYNTYVHLSKAMQTRAAGEDVTFMVNNEIVIEHMGSLQETD